MHGKHKILFHALAICGIATTNLQGHGCGATPYFSIRSQGVNAAREMIGWQQLINRCCVDEWYGAAAGVLEYSQSFRSDDICECLFGDTFINTCCASTCVSDCTTDCDSDCGCAIKISGRCVADRAENDWLADYFGLPTDFESTIRFSPKIKNWVADLEFYLGLDCWAQGLYCRLNLPITHTRWNLGFCETVTAVGENTYPEGYFTPQAVPRNQLLNNATEFFSGWAAPDLATGQTTAQVAFQPLKCSKWAADNCSCKGLSMTRLADIEFVLGYNFVCNEDYYFGLNIRTEAPTGNTPQGEFLFEPIVGNGHHWTLGGGLDTHAVLWRSQECDTRISFYLDANITHLFKNCQRRSFDLCAQGANSRYMLAQKLGENTLSGAILNGGPDTEILTPSDSKFINAFAPVANLTCSNVDVSISVQGDLALKFAYESECGLNVDLGYNFWGRACEKICRTGSACSNVTLSDWALKGDAHVYGFTQGGGAQPSALAATQTEATIHTGTNITDGDCSTNLNNPAIDNAQLAWRNITVLTDVRTGIRTQTNTSIQPEVLSADQINFAPTRGLTSKLFTNISYTWQNCPDRWMPFVGGGAAVEFAHNGSCDSRCSSTGNTDCCTTGCDSNNNCSSCALSQWSVWIKGGVAY